MVASHQWHPPGLPPVGDLGECPHHHLEVGGGLPTLPGVRADGSPPPHYGRGRGSRPGGGGPTPPQGRGSRLRRAGIIGLCGRHPGGGPGRGLPAGDGPHDGGVAASHGPKRTRGQVLLLGPGGTGRPGGPTPGCPDPAGGNLPPTWRRRRHWGLQDYGAGVVLALGGGPERSPPPPPSLHLRPPGAGNQHASHPLALHGVAVASVTDPDLRGLGTAFVRALWGATRLSRAKEIVFSVLSKGHCISPVMHTRYEQLLWVARRPGVTQVFAQAIWESGGCPPGTGPVGRALQTAATVGWSPREGWWC